MENILDLNDLNNVFLDFSENNQVSYWADKLGISPELMKSAARACHNNALGQIISYLQSCSKLSKDFSVN